MPFSMFPYIRNVIIPIDSYFSEGWPWPTNQQHVYPLRTQNLIFQGGSRDILIRGPSGNVRLQQSGWRIRQHSGAVWSMTTTTAAPVANFKQKQPLSWSITCWLMLFHGVDVVIFSMIVFLISFFWNSFVSSADIHIWRLGCSPRDQQVNSGNVS